MSEQGSMLVSQPEQLPSFLDGLRKIFATEPDIVAAYFAQVAIAGEHDKTRYVVGVATRDAARLWSEMIGRVAALIRDADPIRPVDIRSIKAGDPSDKWFKILNVYEPFYTRAIP